VKLPPIFSRQGSQNAWKSKRLLLRFGFALFVLTLSILQAGAQSSQVAGGFPEVETKWPGVRFQLFRIERIPSNRLVVAVRIFATDKAPRSGTFLGTRIPIPANANREDIGMGLYDPKPFSLAGAMMIDEQSKQKYPVLPSIAPVGKRYLPSATLASLMPGQAEMLTIQFAIPPLPPGEEPQKQTASFVFPEAKGPIVKVQIPPPATANESAVQSR
jgi:hypothetical protein